MRTVFFLLVALAVGGCVGEKDLRRAYAEANYCQVAADCADVVCICPFSCGQWVHGSEVRRLEELCERYKRNPFHAECDVLCGQEVPQEVACVEKRCVLQPVTLADSEEAETPPGAEAGVRR